MDNRKVIKSIKNYIDTYHNQFGWEKYKKDTVLNDLVYGIGIAIDKEKYQYANGYDEFKKELIKFLTNPDE